jgi:hypothetical protein
MIIALFLAILVLITEMILYILRAVQIENVTETHKVDFERAEAQFRSGSLVTATTTTTTTTVLTSKKKKLQ